VVVGGGVTGTATALAAARRGLRTVLLERFHLGHRHGSSHGPSRIIRLSYHEADYVTLAREAYGRWRALEREYGQSLLRTTGGLDCGMPGTPSLELTIETMRQADVPFELLSSGDLVARYPQIAFDPGMVGVHQPDAAVLYADDCVAALARRAVEYGAEIRERSFVRRVESTPDGVRVAGNGTEIDAGAAVITAGSWANPLLAGLGRALPLSVTREQVGYFAASRPAAFDIGRFPLVLEHHPALAAQHATRTDLDNPPMAAAFPQLSPRGAVKLMFHRNGPMIDPECYDTTGEPAALADLVGYARRRFPALGSVTEVETCRYTMTPDEDFVLDVVPGHPRIVVASACSGHGFKFGPVTGEMIVDLLSAGVTSRPAARFAMDRPALTTPD
jgi:sarcosine oxidase